MISPGMVWHAKIVRGQGASSLQMHREVRAATQVARLAITNTPSATFVHYRHDFQICLFLVSHWQHEKFRIPKLRKVVLSCIRSL